MVGAKFLLVLSVLGIFALVTEAEEVEIPKYLQVNSTGGAGTAQLAKMGIYELMDEKVHNFPVWKKEGAEEYLYADANGYWSFGSHLGGSRDQVDIYSPKSAKDHPTPLTAAGWMLYRTHSGGWRTDTGFTIDTFSKPEPIVSDTLDTEVTVEALALTSPKVDCFENDMDFPGQDLDIYYTAKESAAKCQAHCNATAACKFFTWSSSNKRCYLKSRRVNPTVEAGATSGPKKC